MWSCKLTWILMLPALFALAPSIVQPQNAETAKAIGIESEFKEAMAARDQGDLNRAQALLSDLHARRPGIFAVDESLGLIYASQGEFAHALPLLEAAAREQPSSDAAHVNFGAVLYKLRHTQRALQEFEQAVRINPHNFSAQQSLGRLWMDRNKPIEAARALQAALNLRPDDSDLAMDCVTALLAANQVVTAQQILSKLPNPDQSARAQSLMGEADEKQGKFRRAVRHFARAAELDPSEENAWMLGFEFLHHWTFDAAEIEFEAASAKFPESQRLRLGLGAAYYGDAKYPQAISAFADLLEKEPDNAMYANLLGISCNAIMQTSSPRCQVLMKYAHTHPSDAIAATYAASWLLTQNQDRPNLDSAAKLLTVAIAANPNLPDAQYQMAVILQDKMNWRGSIPYLERAVKLRPDFAEAHYRLARAYWRTGRKADGDAQMELQRKFSHQNAVDLDKRLQQIERFVVNVQR